MEGAPRGSIIPLLEQNKAQWQVGSEQKEHLGISIFLFNILLSSVQNPSFIILSNIATTCTLADTRTVHANSTSSEVWRSTQIWSLSK